MSMYNIDNSELFQRTSPTVAEILVKRPEYASNVVFSQLFSGRYKHYKIRMSQLGEPLVSNFYMLN